MLTAFLITVGLIAALYLSTRLVCLLCEGAMLVQDWLTGNGR